MDTTEKSDIQHALSLAIAQITHARIELELPASLVVKKDAFTKEEIQQLKEEWNKRPVSNMESAAKILTEAQSIAATNHLLGGGDNLRKTYEKAKAKLDRAEEAMKGFEPKFKELIDKIKKHHSFLSYELGGAAIDIKNGELDKARASLTALVQVCQSWNEEFKGV